MKRSLQLSLSRILRYETTQNATAQYEKSNVSYTASRANAPAKIAATYANVAEQM